MCMIYIDVRTPEEIMSRHHPDAMNFPVEQMSLGMFPELPKDAQICVYCRSGARSGMAKQLLEQVGFTHVTNGGGIDDVFPQ